jgi:hypothetical protein
MLVVSSSVVSMASRDLTCGWSHGMLLCLAASDVTRQTTLKPDVRFYAHAQE